ncbi:MAG TPA: methyltransferase domain-containing protein [Propionicimonas sp.]
MIGGQGHPEEHRLSLAIEAPDLGTPSPESPGATTVRISLDVEDPDGVTTRAMTPEALEMFPVENQLYGVRQGRVVDPFGHRWLMGDPSRTDREREDGRVPSNTWNRVIYRAWAPVYDLCLERFFRPGRLACARLLALSAGERVLIVGVGTGLDLPWLPAGVTALGVDLSGQMLERAERRVAHASADIELHCCDASELGVASASFDAAILSLILSVVPDPVAVLNETMRAVRPGGRAVVFDKFAPDGTNPSRLRRVLSRLTAVFGTEVDRRLEDILAGAPCVVVHNEPSILHGQYRVVLLARDPHRDTTRSGE